MESIRKNAADLVALSPDVILAAGGAAMTPLHQASNAAFATFVRERLDALYVGPDPLFLNERDRIVSLVDLNDVHATYADREITEAGGLISYGASRKDAYRQAGAYVGRILKGDKPGDLPVTLPTKFELVINLRTAKARGLDVSPTLLARADEVIE